jgi:3-keto steroid reductase
MEAQEDKYTPSDFQGFDPLKTAKPYESAKYQCELAALGLEELLDRSRMRTQPGTPLPYALEEVNTELSSRSASGVLEPKSYLAHPGVVASSIFAECLNVFLAACMKLAFYIARWTFSKHHNIEGYKGAVAASHVALAPSNRLDTSTRYGAQSDFFAREYVFAGKIDAWYTNTPRGAAKKEKEKLFKTFAQRDSGPEYSQQREGNYVRILARDVIEKCEGIAKQVWKEAREGALPPFSELDDNGYQVDEGENKEQIKASMLSSDLLPRVNGAANASQRLLKKDDSLSSQEDWEKVDGTV